MTAHLSRLQVLRGDFKGRELVLRPPYALDEAAFTDACTRCGDCLKLCPQAILITGRGGFPEIRFSEASCTFCLDCVSACKTGALSQKNAEKPLPYIAYVNNDCLSARGIVCRVCASACDNDAMTFRPALGGKSTLEINPETCSGCGACVAPCPVDALTIAPPSNIRPLPTSSTTGSDQEVTSK